MISFFGRRVFERNGRMERDTRCVRAPFVYEAVKRPKIADVVHRFLIFCFSSCSFSFFGDQTNTGALITAVFIRRLPRASSAMSQIAFRFFLFGFSSGYGGGWVLVSLFKNPISRLTIYTSPIQSRRRSLFSEMEGGRIGNGSSNVAVE